jgi:hypothetical protein
MGLKTTIRWGWVSAVVLGVWLALGIVTCELENGNEDISSSQAR